MYSYLDQLNAQMRYAELLRQAAQERLAATALRVATPASRHPLAAVVTALRGFVSGAPQDVDAERALQQMM